MELLKQRILQDGRCFPGGILKVDSFINHQMDPMLLYKVAEEFIYRFRDADINKIVTIEASGIAPAIMVGYIMHLPVVFIKKKQPKTMENMLSTVVHSFTKDRDYTVCISNNFLTADDRILFIDDFLAYGNGRARPGETVWRQAGRDGLYHRKSIPEGTRCAERSGRACRKPCHYRQPGKLHDHHPLMI